MHATTVCPNRRVSLVSDVIAGPEGEFVLHTFDPTCATIQFSAAYEDQFWLRTCNNSLLRSTPEDCPVLNVIGSTSPPPVRVRLAERGGIAQFTVWEEVTRMPVYGGLTVWPTDGQSTPIIQLATGEDGSHHSILLPVGDYEVRLEQFHCGDKTYFTETEPTAEFSVTEGATHIVRLSFAVTALTVKSSYDNPNGEPCDPGNSGTDNA